METWTAVCKLANSENAFTSYTKFLDTKINCTNVFVGQSLKAIEINTKLNKGKLVKLKSFCIIEGNQKQNYKTTNRMGENIYK